MDIKHQHHTLTPRPRRQSTPVTAFDDFQSTNYYTASTTSTSTIYTDSIPETSEVVLAEQKESLLKRRSSWKKFKDKISSWVTAGHTNNTPASESPTLEDASALLTNTNCYSSNKESSTRSSIGFHQPTHPLPIPTMENRELPQIVITPEDPEMKKKMAVAKIKEAIIGLNPDLRHGLLVESPSASMSRRHSSVETFGENGEGSNRRRNSSLPLSRSNSAKGRSKPMIWDHFDPVPNNSGVGKCKTCHMAVSCKFNTGQFVRHLQNTHKDVYRKYQAKMDSQWTKSVIEKNLK